MPTIKQHPCIRKVDRALAKQGMRLFAPISLRSVPKRIYVEVELVMDSKKKLGPRLAATFCPFCGEKMPQ